MRLSSSRKYSFLMSIYKSFLRRQMKTFNLYVVLLVQSLLYFFLWSSCFRILLFLVPFINQLSLDPFVAKNPKPLLAEKLSRTIYLDPLVSEKLKNQLICKINNAALGPFGEVSFFGHFVRFIKMWTKVCYETSCSTKVSFFFYFFFNRYFFRWNKKQKTLSNLQFFLFSRCNCWKKNWKTPHRFFKFELSLFVCLSFLLLTQPVCQTFLSKR